MLLDPAGILPTLEWKTRDRLKAFAKDFERETGLDFKLRASGGVRTCAYQNGLYAQGRTSGGSIVTNARGCSSWHVQGRAVDGDPWSKSGYGRPDADYKKAGAVWKRLGGVWGGDFSNLYDPGHLEWHPDMNISDSCPDPSQCSAFQIQTKDPHTGMWIALGAVALLGVTATVWTLRQRS